jgi:hypothetical protein
MWRVWIGVNSTHSMYLILFGLIYGYLAIAHDELLFRSPFLAVVGFIMLAGLFAICKAYFFSVPFTAVGIALTCFIASIIASRL